jgi:fatty-acyl-CoA synthase
VVDHAALHRGVSFADLAVASLRRYPHRVALVHGELRLTYREVERWAAGIAAALSAHGFGRGDGMVVLTGNSPYYLPALLAVAALGGHVTPLHPLLSEADQAFIIGDSKAKALMFNPSLFDEHVSSLTSRLETKPDLYALGPSGLAVDVLALAEEQPVHRLRPTATADDVVALVYSSGTTGQPKGVVQKNCQSVEMVKLCIPAWQLPHEEFRFLAVTPISHASQAFVLPALMAGGTVVLDEGFHPQRFCQLVAEHEITVTFAVPTMIYALLDSGELQHHDLSSLTTIVYGAAPMSPARLEEALRVFGPVFVQLYGQAEAPATVCSLRKDEHDPTRPGLLASCGQPVPGVLVEIHDDHDAPVDAGVVGEICVRGPLVSEGYWQRPAETEELFRNGWLHTGDMAYADGDGYLFIVDRRKDMIITGGMNVFAREVEDVLTAHPAVAVAAVIGVPDDRWGEAVTAFVAIHPDYTVTGDELSAHVRDRKGPIFAPKKVHLVDSIPLTAIGKPDRKALRAEAWTGQQRNIH